MTRCIGQVHGNKLHVFEKADQEEMWSSICLKVYKHESEITFLSEEEIAFHRAIPHFFCLLCNRRLEEENDV